MNYSELMDLRASLEAELRELAEVVGRTGLLEPRAGELEPTVQAINREALGVLQGVESRLEELRDFLGYSSESNP